MKHSASRPRTLSTETTKGVKEAWRTSAASQCFLFFSSWAGDIIAATSLKIYIQLTACLVLVSRLARTVASLSSSNCFEGCACLNDATSDIRIKWSTRCENCSEPLMQRTES